MYDRCVRTGLAALLVLCTLVQDGTAIDLSRLYGHHNKRELMVNGEQRGNCENDSGFDQIRNLHEKAAIDKPIKFGDKEKLTSKKITSRKVAEV